AMAESRVLGVPTAKASESDGEGQDHDPGQGTSPAGAENATAGPPPAKKKKSKAKKEKIAAALTGDGASAAESSQDPGSTMTPQMIDSVLDANPSLKGELSSMNKAQAAELLKKMDIAQLLTGLSVGGKNQKDMASHKFWQTQ